MIELCRLTGLAYPAMADHEAAIADLNDVMFTLEGETAATSFAGLHAKLMVAALETGTAGPSITQAFAGERGCNGSTDHLAAPAWARNSSPGKAAARPPTFRPSSPPSRTRRRPTIAGSTRSS